MASSTVSSQHLIKKSDSGDQYVPFDPNLVAATPVLTNAITAESLVYYSSSLGYMLPLNSGMGTGASADFVGVCCDTVPAQYGSAANPQGISPDPVRNLARVTRACQMFLKATGGDNINPNALIYPGADEQTMTVTAGGQTAIGYVDPEQAAVTGATAGTLILCRVRANYPNTPLS